MSLERGLLFWSAQLGKVFIRFHCTNRVKCWARHNGTLPVVRVLLLDKHSLLNYVVIADITQVLFSTVRCYCASQTYEYKGVCLHFLDGRQIVREHREKKTGSQVIVDCNYRHANERPSREHREMKLAAIWSSEPTSLEFRCNKVPRRF